mgnify:CR=1
GGGISDIHILNNYENLGADHFSISTVCFNPIQLYKLYNDYSTKFGINWYKDIHLNSYIDE